MKLKKNVKYTSSVRHQINIQKNLLSKYNSISKNLICKKRATGGRNNTGSITVRHIGAGCKKNLHKIALNKKVYGLIVNVMYGTTFSSFISLNFDLKRKTFFKTLTTKNTFPGCLTYSSEYLKDFKLGYRSILRNLPTGIILNSLSINSKLKFAKSAGTFCQLIEKRNDVVKIKLPSSKLIHVSANNHATIGYLDNSTHKLTIIGKAGRNRLKGIRPSVRGIAMNPVDHPHGGKSNKGMPQVTPWGIPTKNKKTRKY